VRGRDVIAHVLAVSTQSPLDARSGDGARVWTGRVPATGDYFIDVMRTTPSGDAVLTYWLTVSVR